MINDTGGVIRSHFFDGRKLQWQKQIAMPKIINSGLQYAIMGSAVELVIPNDILS